MADELGESITVNHEEALSAEQGVNALEDLFSEGPAEEPTTSENKVQTEDTDETETSPEPEAEDVEADAEDPDDQEDEEDPEDVNEDEDQDDSEPAPVDLDDDTVIEFEDGTKAPLSELKDHYGQVQKRVADFHRDYSQKTEALAADRRTVAEQSQRVVDWAAKIKQQRDLVYQLQLENLPEMPPPELAETSPEHYTILKARHEAAIQKMQMLEQDMQLEQQEMQQQQEQSYQEASKQAYAKVVELMPELKSPANAQKFATDVAEHIAPAYGYDINELSQSLDPRMALITRDLIAYRKLLASKPKAKAKLKGKPPVMRAGKSQSRPSQARTDAKRRTDKLRQTGSLESFVDAAMDLI